MSISGNVERLLQTGVRLVGATPLSHWHERFDIDGADLLRFPCNPPRTSWLEAFATKLHGGVMNCTVCGEFNWFSIKGENLREDCTCAECGSINRNRQIAYLLCRALSRGADKPIHSLVDLKRHCSDLKIYNTEASGPIHTQLQTLSGYRCSEYFGSSHQSGEIVKGIMHQDLMALSWEDNSLDFVLSSDVFEHIPDPYRAHQEVCRVLKPGGRHIFTVPFDLQGFLDDTRAKLDVKGNPVFLAPPIYHGDPLSPQGILVYTIFGLEMLVRLRRIGFLTNFFHLSVPWLGIIGPNALVFESVKL